MPPPKSDLPQGTAHPADLARRTAGATRVARETARRGEMPQWAAFTINRDKLELTPGTKPFSAATKSELDEGRTDGCVFSQRRRRARSHCERKRRASWQEMEPDLRRQDRSLDAACSRTSDRRVSNAVMSHLIHHRGLGRWQNPPFSQSRKERCPTPEYEHPQPFCALYQKLMKRIIRKGSKVWYVNCFFYRANGG
jgi:hypothetical protein